MVAGRKLQHGSWNKENAGNLNLKEEEGFALSSLGVKSKTFIWVR